LQRRMSSQRWRHKSGDGFDLKLSTTWNHDMFRIWKHPFFFGSAITWKPGWNGMGLERQWIGVLSWSDSLITSLSLAVSRNKWVCAKVGYVPQNSKSNQEDDDQSVNFRVPYQTNPTAGPSFLRRDSCPGVSLVLGALSTPCTSPWSSIHAVSLWWSKES
jgi:hypothetical protein